MDLMEIAFGEANHSRVMARTVISINLYRMGMTQRDIGKFLNIPQPRVNQLIKEQIIYGDDIYFKIYNDAFYKQKDAIVLEAMTSKKS